MIAILGLAWVLTAPADRTPKELPMKLELFAAEDWYKAQVGDEQVFEGVLRYSPRAEDVVGFDRFNAFRLAMSVKGRQVEREVHVAGKDELLKKYADRRIRLIGKAVDMEVEGKTHAEIWPARLELLTDEPGNKPVVGKPMKILGRASWRASPNPGTPGQLLVIRNRDEFAAAVKPETDVDAALARVAKSLQVDGVDWSKRMLIVVAAGAKSTGGYKMEISTASIHDGVMSVHWKLHSPKPGDLVTQAFTNPAQVVLVEAFDGKVVFDPPTTAKR